MGEKVVFPSDATKPWGAKIMRVYLSGPISLGGTLTEDEVLHNIAKFKLAAIVLRAAGNEVLSPVEVPKQANWEDYMRLCVPMVCKATHVAVLDGFENSRGSIFEVLVANTIGIPVFRFVESK